MGLGDLARAYLSKCVKELLRVIGLPAGIPAGSGGTDHERCEQGDSGAVAVLDGGGEKHVLGIWLAKTPPQTATATCALAGAALAISCAPELPSRVTSPVASALKVLEMSMMLMVVMMNVPPPCVGQLALMVLPA
jgi:hypothetical protein